MAGIAAPTTISSVLGDRGQILRRVRRVSTGHAPLYVDSIELADVFANAVAKNITWESVAAVPLCGGQLIEPGAWHM
ncbi:hypothetical protein ACTPOK_01710 [Streptomyces inhibens]|uniref:hypothetical protein n=1 Tax=Streptomyces inhibens TaxID=2293571 RepID=UPI00402A8230